MNKPALIEAVASQSGVSKKDATAVFDAFESVVTKELTSGNKVSLTGFGAFSVTERKAREGINPQTKEKIQIAATKVPKFKAGKTLKDAVR